MKISLERRIFNCIAYFAKLVHPVFSLVFMRLIIGIVLTNVVRLRFDSSDIADRFYDFLTMLLYAATIIRKNVVGLKDSISQEKSVSIIRMLFFGLLISFVFSFVVYVFSFISVLDKYFNSYIDAVGVMLTGTNSFLVLMLVVLFSPMIEEYIFRHHFMNVLSENLSEKMVVIIDSLIFAFLHASSLLWFFLAFLFSMILCAVYNIYDYKTCVCIHMGFNSVNLIYYFINNNFEYNYLIVDYQKYIYLVLLMVGTSLLIVFYKDIIITIYKYLRNKMFINSKI